MATTKQKEAARKNLEKARQAQSDRSGGGGSGRSSGSSGSGRSSGSSKSAGSSGSSGSGSSGLPTADKDRLDKSDFAFPEERKEPLTDARHVRNAVARFNQVEGVTAAERDKAWKRIKAAAKKFDVELSESDWRELG